MSKIIVEKPSSEKLAALGVTRWPTWSKEVSGEFTVTPNGGEPVSFSAGDLVTFPAGMSCTWNVKKALRKHYQLG